MGFIYIIRCSSTNKVYIGQTTTSLQQRWYAHQREARRLAKDRVRGETPRPGIGESPLYNAMVRYGVDKFVLEPLESVPDDKLDLLEQKYIALFHSDVEGYNVASGGRTFQHASASVEKIRETKKANVEEHRHPKLQGMPMHTSYMAKAGGYEAIRIANHPLCKDRIFSTVRYGTFEKARAAVCEFLEQLEATTPHGAVVDNQAEEKLEEAPGPQKSDVEFDQLMAELGIEVAEIAATERTEVADEIEDVEIVRARADLQLQVRTKPETGLPAGVIKRPNGYKVFKRINKKLYQKCFESAKQSDEEKKEAAIAYLQELLSTHGKNKVQRLNVSGPGRTSPPQA